MRALLSRWRWPALVALGAAGLAALAGAALAVAAAAQAQPSLAGAARLGLGLFLVGAATLWVRRAAGGGGASAARASRLELVRQVPLSQSTAAALLEVDGERYLVLHGQAFARVRRLERTPRSAPRARLAVVGGAP